MNTNRGYKANIHGSLLHLLMAMFLLFINGNLFAIDFEINGIKYYTSALTNTNVKVTGKTNSYTGAIVIPESVSYQEYTYTVTTIDEDAFYGNTDITSIVIPPTIDYIDESAFSNCSNLDIVYITSIESWLNIGFDNAHSNPLENASHLYINGKEVNDVVIPEGITTINDYAFYSFRGIKSVSLPKTLKWIYLRAFSDCENLELVVSKCFTPPHLDTEFGNPFGGISSNAKLVVPKGSKEAYLAIPAWSANFKEIVEETDNYNLSMTATGNGKIVCPNDIIVRNETKVFQFEDGGEFLFQVIADEGYTYDLSNTATQAGGGSSRNGNNWKINGIKKDASVTVKFKESTKYNLTIKSTGKGSVSFEGTTVRDNTCSFSVYAGTIATFTFTPDNGYRIKSVKKNNTDVTSSVSNSTYTIISISSDTNIEVEFEADSRITFADANVKAICVANWDTDGDGELSEEEAKSVSDIATVFKQTEIESFDELKFFLGLTKIPSGAFDNCKKLTRIQIPNNVTSIEGYTFYNCQSLSSISIPNGVQSIGAEAFRYCSSLINIFFSEGLKTIGSRAFDGCKNLSTISCPESLTFIDQAAFASSGISHIDLSINMTAISYQAFSGCQNLSSITIPGNIKKIGSNAFELCTQLSTVDIEDGVQTIESYSFSGCSNLKSIFIPQSVTSVSSITPFSRCASLSTIVVDERNTKYDSRDNCNAIILTSTNTLVTGCKGTKIPNTVTSIGNYSFEGCYGIYDLSLPASILTIGKSAFQYCYDLSTLTIPNSVTSIGDGAFYACNKLNTVHSEIKEPYEISNGVFRDISSNSKLYVPYGTKSQYESLAGWTKYFQEIVEEQGSIETYTLFIKATGNGYVAYDGNIVRGKTSSFTVNGGTNATIKFSADEGNRLKSVKLNGTDITYDITGNQYVVNNISANTSIEVVFEEIPRYSLDITATGNGSITYNGTSIRNQSQGFALQEGSSAVISITPDNGYRIASVKVNSKDATSQVANGKLTITSIQQDTNVEVTFEAIPATTCTLSITATGNGVVTYDGKNVRNQTSPFTVAIGTYATVLFAADEGYRLKRVKLDGKDVTADVANDQYTTSKLTEDAILMVEFEAVPTYSLTVKSSQYGSVRFGDEVVKNETKTFSITEGASAVLTFTPDNNGRLQSVTLNGTDITQQLSNGQYTISNIRANQDVEAVFTEDVTKVTYEGVAYTVTSYNNQTVVVAAGNYGNVLVVPASFTIGGLTWKVEGVAEGALMDNKELAAIVWKPALKFTEKVSNPNLLLYVKQAQFASPDIQNVILGDMDNGETLLADDITLVEADNDNDFYCPLAFIAKHISYEHNYSMISGHKSCQGWETLVLPFDVSMMISPKGRELVPYTSWEHGSNLRPYWLYELTAEGWKAANGIKANTPYIISMPNNEAYESSYNITGDIQFVGYNVQVVASDKMTNGQYGNKRLVANYRNQKANNGIYALNVNNRWNNNTDTSVEGSAFIRGLRQVRPFEAYMALEGGNAGIRAIPVFGNETTGIMTLPTTGLEDADAIYNLNGQRVNSMSRGIYIQNGRKVVKKK